MKKILAIAYILPILLTCGLKEDLFYHIEEKLYHLQNLESVTADFLDSSTHLFIKGMELSYLDILYIIEKYESIEISKQ